jgi:sodium/hydrogen exchanger 8
MLTIAVALLTVDGPSLGAVLAIPNDAKPSEADEEAAETKETMFLWACVLGVMALAVTLAIGALLEQRHVHRLPEAGVGVLIGALAAALASNLNTAMLDDERFDFEFFLVWLLPPIIFAAGFNIDLSACIA